MICVDIYVPIMDRCYDFRLEETAEISLLIKEIASAICDKEHWPVLDRFDGLDLFSPQYERRLNRGASLEGEGVFTGQRLILC